MLAVMFFLDFLVMGFVVVGVSSLEMPPDCGVYYGRTHSKVALY